MLRWMGMGEIILLFPVTRSVSSTTSFRTAPVIQKKKKKKKKNQVSDHRTVVPSYKRTFPAMDLAPFLCNISSLQLSSSLKSPQQTPITFLLRGSGSLCEDVLQSLYRTLGLCRNSAYSSVPSTLCSCRTRGRRVTMPAQRHRC